MCLHLKNVQLCNDNFSFRSSNWNERQFAATKQPPIFRLFVFVLFMFLQQQSAAAAEDHTSWGLEAADRLCSQQFATGQNNWREAVLSLQNLYCDELPPVFADANMLIIVLTDHFYVALFSASEQSHCASRAFSACWLFECLS